MPGDCDTVTCVWFRVRMQQLTAYTWQDNPHIAICGNLR